MARTINGASLLLDFIIIYSKILNHYSFPSFLSLVCLFFIEAKDNKIDALFLYCIFSLHELLLYVYCQILEYLRIADQQMWPMGLLLAMFC